MLSDPGYKFIHCDTSCLYKIIRNFSRVRCPTHGWGRQVINYNNYGDLVAKLREIRNSIVHRPHVRFSQTEMDLIEENFGRIIDAICRTENNDDLKKDMQSYVFWPYLNHSLEYNTFNAKHNPRNFCTNLLLMSRTSLW